MDFSRIRHFIFLGLLALSTLAFFYIVRSFIYPIFWALVFAVMFFPLFKKIEKKIRNSTASSLLTLFIIFLIIIIPVTIIGTIVVRESMELYTSMQGTSINNSIYQITEWIKHNQMIAKLNLNNQWWADRVTDLSQTTINFIFSSLKNFTQNSLEFLGLLLIMFFTLFYFLKDGEKILKRLTYLSPLGDKYDKDLYKKFTSTVRSTLKGALVIGGLQAITGGIIFAITGINGALIWAMVMFLLALVPILSSMIVWLPAGIIMLILGHIWQGVLILTVGIVIMSTVDNLLRPIIIGKGSQMHPLLILFSTLGGIFAFGISGFIIGPVIAALLVSLWEMYEQYFREELKDNNDFK